MAANKEGAVIIRQKVEIFHVTKKRKRCHQYEGPVVWLSSASPVTTPARCFTSLSGRLVRVRLVMVGWSCRRLLYKISTHEEIIDTQESSAQAGVGT